MELCISIFDKWIVLDNVFIDAKDSDGWMMNNVIIDVKNKIKTRVINFIYKHAMKTRYEEWTNVEQKSVQFVLVKWC